MSTQDDEHTLLRSTALQTASSILVARRRAEQRQEAYLAEAQRLSHTGSFGWKPATGEIIWSEETFRIFQLDRTTQPTVERALERVHPEDVALMRETIARASQDGKDFEHGCRLLMPDDCIKHIQIVAHASSDASGGLEFVGAVMDITERRHADDALRRSEGYLAEAQKLTHTGSWAWGVAPREALHLSEEWYRIYGLDPEEGRPTWEELLLRVHPEDRAQWQEAVARAADYELEFRVLLPGGTVKYVQSAGHPVFNASGDLLQFVGSSTDISDRKRAEMLLAGEKRLLEMIARGDSLATILDGLCRLVEDLVSGSLSSILLLDADAKRLRHGAAPSLPSAYSEAIDGIVIGPSVGSCGTAAYRGEPVMVRDIATDPLWVDFRNLAMAHGLRACWSTPIRSAQGTVLGTFAIYYREPRSPAAQEHNLIDQITHIASIAIERKQAEEALREQSTRLRQAEKMEAVGRLAGGIAHDFNNILGAILGYGELAQKGLEGRAARRHVDQVMQAGARGKELVERILAFSRSGLGERVPVHVQSVVEEALEILSASLATNVRLEQRLDVGDTAVVGDATQLHQVAMNLCTNALQAMEHGGVLTVVLDRAAVSERRTLSHGTLSPGSHVRLAVSDTGSGIPSAVLERMFDPFFTTKGVGEGTGLGLSLVHGIVADFGGAIDVTTQAGAGTTFTVWLPAAGETARILSEAAGDLPLGNGETVMIIDDQSSLVALAEETLAALGYDPAGFRSSVAALRAFRADPQRYDLVLTDETMPDMSGVDLAREMRRVRPELPILLMSGYSGPQLTERAHAVGVGEVLRKPLVRRDIAQALGRALRPSDD